MTAFGAGSFGFGSSTFGGGSFCPAGGFTSGGPLRLSSRLTWLLALTVPEKLNLCRLSYTTTEQLCPCSVWERVFFEIPLAYFVDCQSSFSTLLLP